MADQNTVEMPNGQVYGVPDTVKSVDELRNLAAATFNVPENQIGVINPEGNILTGNQPIPKGARVVSTPEYGAATATQEAGTEKTTVEMPTGEVMTFPQTVNNVDELRELAARMLNGSADQLGVIDGKGEIVAGNQTIPKDARIIIIPMYGADAGEE